MHISFPLIVWESP